MRREDQGIISDSAILREEYVPADIPARERQIEELKGCLLPAKKGSKPIHAWVHGKPGTGKTTVVKYLLEKLDQEAGVRGIHVNCWKRTFYSILDDILNELRVLGSERRETGFKLEKLRKALDGKPFIIALDEVDQISNKERNAMLYNLNFDKVGLICIGYNRKVLTFMDERVKSRLNPRQVEFPRYRVDDLVNILKRRAELALVPDSWGRKTLLKVAKLAQGDARVAIQTLRNAAKLAENNGDDAISIKHIQKGFSSTNGLKKHYQLRSLSEHHKVIYQIVKERGKVKSGELKEKYRKECKKRELDPMAERTVDKYIKELIEHRFIKKERAKVRGRVYSYQVAD